MRVELDKRGIDLDSILYPWCESDVETVNHCLVKCKEAKEVWDKVFKWRGFQNGCEINDIIDIVNHIVECYCSVYRVLYLEQQKQ